MEKTYQARPLRKLEVEVRQTKIDIIIPYHGQYEKVYRLLKSIWMGTKGNPYRIYLVDDNSPNDKFIGGFEKAPFTTIKHNPNQLGFGGSLATGFTEATSDFVVFMHSDCVIEDPQWLKELLISYLSLRNQGVGLVSARSDNPGEDAHPQLKAERSEKTKDVILKEGYVPLYCAFCERNLFNQIKGFIKPYPFGYYEDEELAYRMRRYGLKQAISGKSWVHHEGGATFNSLFKKDPSLSQIIEENRRRCIADIKSL